MYDREREKGKKKKNTKYEDKPMTAEQKVETGESHRKPEVRKQNTQQY